MFWLRLCGSAAPGSWCTSRIHQVHPREVFADVIADRAAAVIFAHNHPSGNPKPSDADRAIHDQLARAARSLGIRVLDHLVIAKAGHYSFQEAGLT